MGYLRIWTTHIDDIKHFRTTLRHVTCCETLRSVSFQIWKLLACWLFLFHRYLCDCDHNLGIVLICGKSSQFLTKQLIFCTVWPTDSLPLCLDHMSKVWARLESKVTFNSVGPVWTCQTTHPHPCFVSHLFVQFYSCPACFHIGL